MSGQSEKPKAKQSQSKIEKIQEIYGKDSSTVTLQDTSNYLKSKGFTSLADLLVPVTK